MCRPFFALFALALLAVAASARADEQSEIEKGRAAYLARHYGEADARFAAMLDPSTGTVHDPALVTQARMYWGAAKLAEGKRDEAVRIFEKLLLADPAFDPDPLSFPTDVLDLFIDTRAKLRDRINAEQQKAAQQEVARKAREEQQRRQERERVALLERMAAEERILERHSRFVASIPFGVGQFQNGQKGLGWFFLATESALLATTAITVPIYLVDLQYRSEAARGGDTFRAQEWIDRATTMRTVNLLASGGLALTAAIGILQANLTFVPEVVVVRKRPIPPPPQLGLFTPVITPTLSPTERGVTFGIVGRF